MSFIRRLRHSFIMKGDTKKHAIFMLAEILLITIGISVALQFDEWSKETEKEATRTQYLIDLKKELESDIAFFTDHSTSYARADLSSRDVLQTLTENNIENVNFYQFANDFRSIVRWSSWIRKPIIWRELQSSGKLDLISNRDLVTELQYYYDEIERHQRNELTIFTEMTNNIRRHTGSLFSLEEMDDYFESFPWNQDTPPNKETIQGILDHPDLSQEIKDYIVWLKVIQLNLNYFSTKASAAIESVELELAKTN